MSLADNSLRARLGSRLYALYDLVPEGAQGVCDVGTDHGLLALALLAGGKCKVHTPSMSGD